MQRIINAIYATIVICFICPTKFINKNKSHKSVTNVMNTIKINAENNFATTNKL